MQRERSWRSREWSFWCDDAAVMIAHRRQTLYQRASRSPSHYFEPETATAWEIVTSAVADLCALRTHSKHLQAMSTRNDERCKVVSLLLGMDNRGPLRNSTRSILGDSDIRSG